MYIDLQQAVEKCHLAIETAKTTEDLVIAAGFAGLIQRQDIKEKEVLDKIYLSCCNEADSIKSIFRYRLTITSEKIEYCQDVKEQASLWFSLFLDIGALFFIDEQAQYAKRIRQICAGIGTNWEKNSSLAEQFLEEYPPLEGDLTRKFLLATMQAGEIEFDDEVGFPVPWLREAMGEQGPFVIDFQPTSNKSLISEPQVLFFGEKWQLLFQKNFPNGVFIFEGTEDCQASFNNEPIEGKCERGRASWMIEAGQWCFLIQGKEYKFILIKRN